MRRFIRRSTTASIAPGSRQRRPPTRRRIKHCSRCLIGSNAASASGHSCSASEADWRLFTTLLRFDPVYHGHFKCNRNRLVDLPELWDYTRTLYQVPGVAETVHFDHIKRHYYGSHRTINPTGVVAAGPRIDFSAPTRRVVPKLGG